MLTNIERAINVLILKNKDITLANVIPAYLREAGFKKMSVEAFFAFEHALDKYPTRTDEPRAVFLKGVSGIIKEYRAIKYDALVQTPYGKCLMRGCRVFNLKPRASTLEHECTDPEEGERKAPKRCLKSKKGRRVRVKGDIMTARFDPFAPSTSTVML